MKKYISSFFCGLFFLSLPACKSFEVQHQYTEVISATGDQYYCEYIKGSTINCKRKEQKNDKKTIAYVFQTPWRW